MPSIVYLASLSGCHLCLSHVLASFPRPSCEHELWRKGIQVGFDGSLVQSQDFVYILGYEQQGFKSPVHQVDWFHGLVDNCPMASLNFSDHCCRAVIMINLSSGFTVQRIVNLQRRWRLRRLHPSRRYERNSIKFCLGPFGPIPRR